MNTKVGEYTLDVYLIGEDTCVNINGKDIQYCNVGSLRGLQCNFVGEQDINSEYQKILRWCDIIAASMVELHKLNKVK